MHTAAPHGGSEHRAFDIGSASLLLRFVGRHWCGSAVGDWRTCHALDNMVVCSQEPKLVNARRIVAEWPALDQEARDFTAQVLWHSQLLGGLQAPDQHRCMPGGHAKVPRI